MNLTEVILKCNQYVDSEEFIYMVFAKRLNDKFESQSEAKVLQLPVDEMEMNLTDIKNSKCPGYDYFLEMNIIQDFFEDIKKMNEYKSDDEKVNRIIYYAEFDA
jgi:methionine synthase II (cobalamin-independent)